MGDDGAKIYSSSGGMKETVVSGENVIAINIIGSYALDWVKASCSRCDCAASVEV